LLSAPASFDLGARTIAARRRVLVDVAAPEMRTLRAATGACEPRSGGRRFGSSIDGQSKHSSR
jgi:hypothetical protein